MKIEKRYNHHVVITPKDNTWGIRIGQQTAIDICKEIISQINRHVDDVHIVEIYSDTDEVCSFCDSMWDEDEHGIPCCCEKAEQEWGSNNPDKKHLI